MMRHTGMRAASLIIGGPHVALALAVLASAMLVGPLLADTPTTVLHSFSMTDGADPHGSLITAGDYLYGMTPMGGTGGGVIYRLNRNGSDFSVLHQFTSGAGYIAYGALAEVSGKLYGLTYGTTFSDMRSLLFNILPDGTGYHVLHIFDYRTEGGYAHGTPVHDGGFLYGFTGGGGSGMGGTVFRYELADSSLDVLHAFDQYAPAGGVTPLGSPLVVNEVIYGMTMSGGSGSPSGGVLFRIDTDGSNFQIIHDFAREENNGAEPYGSLIAVGDSLYGMTRLGGSATTAGMGTVFKVHKTGTGFEVLHRFLGPDYNPAGDDDGMEPYGSLTLNGDYLYGMTPYGGLGSLKGTIFRIKPDGSEYEILHYFDGGITDGRMPFYAAPLCVGSTLYTTTRMGGSVSDYGTVVSMDVGVSVSVPEVPAMPRGPRLAVGTPFPNPGLAGARVVIPFHLPAPDAVTIEIYSASGRLMARRPFETLAASGRHEVHWNTPQLAAGRYFVRVRTRGGLEGGTHWIVLR